MNPSILIAGAGISGLSIAYRLHQRLPNANIVVVEANDRPGGAAWTLREEGFTVEIGPNGFLDTKAATLDLARELGLTGKLVTATAAAQKNRYLYLEDRLRRLPAGLGDFLTSDLLSWRAKLGLFLERWREKGTGEDESIDSFARRRGGREVAEILADALVTGIYAGDPRLLSLPACFPRLAQFEREHGSVLRGFAAAARQRRAEAQANGTPDQRPGAMWSFQGGMRVLSETLAERLPQPAIHGLPLRRIDKDKEPARPRWTVHAEGHDCWQTDAVVLACPAYTQAALLADLDPELAERVATIPYNRLAVVALGYHRGDVPVALDGFGFIAPQNTRRDLLGVQWCSSIYPGRAPAGMMLLRAMCGGWQRPEIAGWEDARLLRAVRDELRQAMGIVAAPVFHKIIRWNRAIPQYHVGHLERLTWIDERLKRHPGLFLAGNAYHGVALNDCTEQGIVIAERIKRYCQGQARETAKR